MTIRQKLLLGIAGVHLLLVAVGAAGLPVIPRSNPLGDSVALYSAASGADNGYGFFAPGVGAQIRTRFILRDANGRTWTEDLQLGNTSEANLRFTGISNLLPTLPAEQRRRILRSMAGTMFGKYPSAKHVTIQLDLYGFDRSATESDFPTMKEYAAGARPQWLPLSTITFSRNNFSSRQAGTQRPPSD